MLKLWLFCLSLTAAGGYLIGQSQSEAKSMDHARFELAQLVERQSKLDLEYLRFMDNATLSSGIYRLKAGAADGQSPHAQDELYYVVEGRASFTAGGEDYRVEPGTILFVAAEVTHRFYDISEDLTIVVFFSKAPPEKND